MRDHGGSVSAMYLLVVDDEPRLLELLERGLRAQERTGQIGIEDGLPLLEWQIFQRCRWRRHARVVEKQIEPPEVLHDAREQRIATAITEAAIRSGATNRRPFAAYT